MSLRWNTAPLGTENWFVRTENWLATSPPESARVMPILQKVLAAFVLLSAVALLAAVALFGPQMGTKPPAQVEVGVLFPGTDEGNWLDFVEGVKLAARERNFGVGIASDRFECIVTTPTTPVRFRWYPAAGGRGIQRRVREVCDQPNPPIALVGANNSSLTRSLAEELTRCGDREKAPVLLMTSATADALIRIHDRRTFRFGFNNSHQAASVVRRYKEFIANRPPHREKTHVIALQVDDDPFSVDLANRFLAQARAQLDAVVVSSPEGADTWRLTTATGSFDDPSVEEWQLARALVRKMTARPEAPWALVLPMGTAAYRRLTFALHQSFHDALNADAARLAKSHLAVLSGDSLGYYSFQEAQLNQLMPDESPAPVIFFSHVNPTDASVPAAAPRDIPGQALNREVARALLAVLPALGNEPTAAALAQALAAYAPADSNGPLFHDGERSEGGGAIVAIPRPETQSFELILPNAWQPAS